jgi:arylsulfatase B
MKLLSTLFCLVLLIGMIGCAVLDPAKKSEADLHATAKFSQPQTVSGLAGASSAPNILLIIGDDMGVETLASYGLGKSPPKTAALDQLARNGVRFNNFWAQPVCSPTRATLMTGRYGFRTGIGRPVGGGEMPAPPEKPAWAHAESTDHSYPHEASAADQSLPRPFLLPDEFTLPMALKTNPDFGYSTAAIGKWHLAGSGNGWTDHPNLAGFDHFAGLMGGGPESYFAWNKVVNGEVIGKVGYTPADKVDDAIAWFGAQDEKPWFLWFAFNLAHTPMHFPPEEYWQSDYSDVDQSDINRENWQASYAAMLEAMDTQIERLLATLDADVRENTYVIFMGDNGTWDPVVSAPFQHGRAKGTIYEGGVNVPLIVSGPGVERGGVSEALVNSTDLFATIMEMAGIDPDEAIPDEVTHDSVSFFAALSNPAAPSRRDWIYADEFFGGFDGVETANYAMRGERYKLLRSDGREEFYDLHADPYEHDDLLLEELTTEQRTAYEVLKAKILLLRSSE